MVMVWVTVAWSMAASACLSLALVHLSIWFRHFRDASHLLFSFTALASACIAGFELAMMHAQTTEQFGAAVGRIHVPVWILVVSLTWFVRLHFGAGRVWLAWAVCITRTISLILSFLQRPNLNYGAITPLRQIEWIGGEKVSVAVRAPSPWALFGVLSMLMLLVFLIDATVTMWRRGERQRAVIPASMILFAALAAGQAILMFCGVVYTPLSLTIAYLVIVLAMSFDLGSDVLRAASLARQLQISNTSLHESQQRIDMATQTGELDLWGWDIARDEMWVMDIGRNLLGLTGPEKINLNQFLQRVHCEDREMVSRSFARSIDGEGDCKSEYRISLSDGRTHWVAARGHVDFNATGKPVRMRGVALDITERRQAEERWRLAVEAAPVAMIMADPQGKMTLVNAKVETVFGYQRSELIGERIDLLLPERLRSQHLPHQTGRAGEPKTWGMGAGRELFGCRKDGSQVPIEVGLGSVQLSDGPFVLASIIDISQRKQAEMEVLQQRSELTHLSRVTTLGELSGSLAHELNQPLTAILSNAQAAQRILSVDGAGLDVVREILKDIVEDDQRAGEIIRRLGALLKKGEVQKLSLDVNHVVCDVLRLANHDLAIRGVIVQTELQPNLPLVIGDSVQLQQVLLNLIINGCDAMSHEEPGDRILSVRTESVDRRHVRVCVKDQGSGIPPDQVESVFDPFFTTKQQGMGLGLTVCRSIIVAHGGVLWASNNPSRGAAFQFTLPTVTLGAST